MQSDLCMLSCKCVFKKKMDSRVYVFKLYALGIVDEICLM